MGDKLERGTEILNPYPQSSMPIRIFKCTLDITNDPKRLLKSKPEYRKDLVDTPYVYPRVSLGK